MTIKSPKPRFIGLNRNDASIKISFIDGDINSPVFKIDGFVIDGDGVDGGVFIAALESMKAMIDTEIAKVKSVNVSVINGHLPFAWSEGPAK